MSLTPISDCPWRRRFSKILVISVVLLIFAGGMVTSTGSGLAVPDWPLSYGMLFPPMVGGVFYEHGHRMIASVVGLFTLILAIWTALTEARAWVRKLAFLSLVVVIAQGLLGGLTVLYFLPALLSYQTRLQQILHIHKSYGPALFIYYRYFVDLIFLQNP